MKKFHKEYSDIFASTLAGTMVGLYLSPIIGMIKEFCPDASLPMIMLSCGAFGGAIVQRVISKPEDDDGSNGGRYA